MSEESWARRQALARENDEAAKAEARALEAEAERMRNFQPPDPMAERRRLERENDARTKREADLDAQAIERAKAAHVERKEQPQPAAPERTNWVTEWQR